MQMMEKEEDRVFSSLSRQQKRHYFDHLHENGGNVPAALDDIVGPVWFDKDGDPKGQRNRRHE